MGGVGGKSVLYTVLLDGLKHIYRGTYLTIPLSMFYRYVFRNGRSTNG